MQVTELKNEGLDLHVKISVPASEISNEVDKSLSNLAKSAKIDGFRVGKAPISMIKKRYGDSVQAEIVEKQFKKAVNKIITDRNLDIADVPQVDDVTNNNEGLSFVIKLELMPKIAMPDFAKISIEKPVFDLKDKEVDERLKLIAQGAPNFPKESKAKAAMGDRLTINCAGYIEGELIENSELKDHNIVLGSKSLVDNFEEQLVGRKAGDDVLVKVTFPKEYFAPSLAGKEATFEVKILEVRKPVTLDIDDEFAKKFHYENLEQMKAAVENSIRNEFNESINTIVKMRLFDQFEDILDFEVPSSLVAKEEKVLRQQTEKSQEAEEMFKGKSDAEIAQYYTKLAVRRVRIGLLLAQYIKNHKVSITGDDMRAALEAQARLFGTNLEVIWDYYKKNPGALEPLRSSALEDKAVEEIFTKIKIKEKKYSKDALEKFLEEENNKVL